MMKNSNVCVCVCVNACALYGVSVVDIVVVHNLRNVTPLPSLQHDSEDA